MIGGLIFASPVAVIAPCGRPMPKQLHLARKIQLSCVICFISQSDMSMIT